MINLEGTEPHRIEGLEFEQTYGPFVRRAAELALRSTCERDHCGAVIVSADLTEILGEGWSGPPDGDESMRMCHETDNLLPRDVKPKSDITCCTHAEVVATFDALSKHSLEAVKGARVVFARVGVETGEIKNSSGHPYCTLCSRHTLQAFGRFGKFVLYSNDGVLEWDLDKYNLASYGFFQKHHSKTV